MVGFKPAAGVRPKVAVTGGSGYLGARFVRALAARGTWDIGGAVRSPSGGGGPRARGLDQLDQCIADCRRAAATRAGASTLVWRCVATTKRSMIG